MPNTRKILFMFSALKIDYSNNFWQKCLCDSEDINSDCWSGSCADCSNGNNKWMVDNEENWRSIKKSTDPKSLHLQLTSGFPHFQKYVKVYRNAYRNHASTSKWNLTLLRRQKKIKLNFVLSIVEENQELLTGKLRLLMANSMSPRFGVKYTRNIRSFYI